MGYLCMLKKEGTLNSEKLKPLSDYVAKITHEIISKRRPLLGKNIFTCETGLHRQGLLLEPATYEPYSPDRVGAQRKLLFGAKSGRKARAQKQQGTAFQNRQCHKRSMLKDGQAAIDVGFTVLD
jgi:homocitrate synthase NifV